MADIVSSSSNPKTQAAVKRAMIVGAAVLALVVAQWKFNLIPTSASKESAVPARVDLASAAPAEATADASVPQAALPGSGPCHATGPLVKVAIWAWNAQMGLLYATGGPSCTAGSLMEKHNVRVELRRQDDTSISQKEQVKFATLLAKGDSNPADGVHFVIIMGDGAAQYIAAVNKLTSKLGPDYKAEVVGAVGYSGNSVSGEDAFMGPAEWQTSPEAARGGLAAGVLRDGDWNTAQMWLAQNGIPNNPDERYYDPTALNWVSADDYIKAADLYIAGHCEDRPIVRAGKVTSEKPAHVCVNGVVTWTPGDVSVAKKRGGLVKLLSTKENYYQMPAVVIGIHKWDVDHAKTVTDLLAATFEGSDQVKHYDAALQRAAKASYAVYAEESPAYWARYYKGVIERDKTGVPVPLGGSRVANLADNLVLFGLSEGSGGEASSVFRASYEGFGNIVKQQYPAILPDFPKASDALNSQFLLALAQTTPTTKADAQVFEATAAVETGNIVAKRNWTIQFETGSARFTPAAQLTLDEMFGVLAVGGALQVEIDGHTDNTGVPATNLALAQDRADAVRAYLERKSPALFPANRVIAKGFGDTQPLVSNDTPEGRAKNRRVTIILGSK